MSCDCKTLQRRLDKLQKKYSTLRKNHKKLLGVSLLLTEALEKFVKGEIKPEINATLSSCSKIYPDLFESTEYATIEGESEDLKNETNSIQITDENGKVQEPETESEREFYEGFLARPKIPRTPQN